MLVFLCVFVCVLCFCRCTYEINCVCLFVSVFAFIQCCSPICVFTCAYVHTFINVDCVVWVYYKVSQDNIFNVDPLTNAVLNIFLMVKCFSNWLKTTIHH